MEVLRRGTHVSNAWGVFEIPRSHRKGRNFVQNLAAVHRREVLFALAITPLRERPATEVASEIALTREGAIGARLQVDIEQEENVGEAHESGPAACLTRGITVGAAFVPAEGAV